LKGVEVLLVSYADGIRLVFALSSALSVFFLVILASRVVGILTQRVQWRWTKVLASLSAMRPLSSEPPVLSEEMLYQLPEMDFRVIYLLVSGVGFAITFVLLEKGQLTLVSLLGLGAFFIPFLWRKGRIATFQWEYQKLIQTFVIQLRMEVSLDRTLSQALGEITSQLERAPEMAGFEEGEATALFQRRLQFHTQRLLSLARPERVVSALAVDFRSDTLDSLLVKIDAAQRGGATYAEALADAVDETMDSMSQNARLAIQEAPMKLLLPMLGGLFPPPVVLIVLPLVTTVMAGMSRSR